MAKMNIADKKCITPPFRISFPALSKPKAFKDQEAKYSVVALIPDQTDITELKKCARNAIIEKWGEDKTQWPKRLKTPFHDGNEKPDIVGYDNTVFFTASAKKENQPGMVDQRLQAVLDVDKTFYAGAWARAEVIAYAYDAAGNRGVGFSLQNLQRLPTPPGQDDKPFSGRRAAETVFDAVEDGSDDAASYSEDYTDEENDLGF